MTKVNLERLAQKRERLLKQNPQQNSDDTRDTESTDISDLEEALTRASSNLKKTENQAGMSEEDPQIDADIPEEELEEVVLLEEDN
ncbi:hypothetical protein GWP49_35470, partial [Klebsiella pneumoniae]|nr:hypothetical protein [Klebsiella pneumoniae]